MSWFGFIKARWHFYKWSTTHNSSEVSFDSWCAGHNHGWDRAQKQLADMTAYVKAAENLATACQIFCHERPPYRTNEHNKYDSMHEALQAFIAFEREYAKR